MKMHLLLSLVLLTVGSLAQADIRRPKPQVPKVTTQKNNFSGFVCQFKAAKSKRNLEIAGFRADAENLPAKYDKMIWAGQVAALEKGASQATLVFDLDQFSVGRSGFAGRNVKVAASNSNQNLKINFATGATGSSNGTIEITRTDGSEVASGPVKCQLL